MEMNVLFSSDDNYARHLGVAMYSLMTQNQKVEKLHFYVVDNQISLDNKSRLEQEVREFSNSSITFISFDSYVKRLHLDMVWPISMSAYARLFAAEILSEDIDRVLYLDCDMVINHDLIELWEFELGDFCIGAVQDQVSSKVKESVGMHSENQYFNSGMLLIDLKKWRDNTICSRILRFLAERRGRVVHHDQGVLNAIFCNKWFRLPLKYNVMTVHYMIPYQKCRLFYNDISSFYSEEEVEDSKLFPFILHFTPSFTSRPWEENCLHPMRSLYQFAIEATPWGRYPLVKDSTPWYLKIINWRYRNLPF